MEKFSQYRDRGTGIAPFLPIPSNPPGVYYPVHVFLFFVRLPALITAVLAYCFVIQWLQIGSLFKKAALWIIMGIPGLWWVDLQIDGVRRGDVARFLKTHFPRQESVIASSMTSPVDSIYLAAIFDPIFTASYPSTRLVQQVSLFNAIVRPFCKPELVPPANTNLVDLDTILRKNPGRSVVVFPECTTSNGQGILTLCPSLLTTPAGIKIFPISIRYTPPDITCPIPGTYVSFLWKLLSKPKHTIRVRVAEPIFNTPPAAPLPSQSYGENYLDKLQKEKGITGAFKASEGEGNLTEAEKKVLDKTQAALARLGRVQRLGLGVKEKMEFIMALSGERIC